ncbi:MAG: SDR family NAD(P)-dependent oxidoreductase [Candidatus Acidiferrales bacterium]
MVEPKKSDNLPLSGAVALVTGGSRGIGLAIAHRLTKLGASVCICGRDENHLKAAADELGRDGAKILAVPAHVSEASDIRALVDRANRELGPIEILVNNAGTYRSGPFHQLSEADWDTVLDTNLKSVFLVSSIVAPSMIERRRGHIINISSLAGKNAFAGGGIYCASKWGLQGLTACMAEDLRAYGIRVASICPGTVATDFSPHIGRDTSKMLQADDVAHTVESLLMQAPQSFISEIDIRPTQKP